MAMFIPDKVSEHGIPVEYWVIRGFAMHDEIWPATKAKDPDYGPVRSIPGTEHARVKVLQIKLEGYASKDSADLGYRSLREYVFHVMGEKADAVWEHVKSGNGNALAALYERLKATADEKASAGIHFPIRNASDL